MIKIENLSKKFKNIYALKDINLNLNKPGVYALVGSNGAGKTTLIKSILGMYLPTKGKININYEKLGYIPETPAFFGLNIYDYIVQSLKLSNSKVEHKKIEEVLKEQKLLEVKKKKVYKLSSGMKQKVFYSYMKILDPDLIIADEPTANMDLSSKRKYYSNLEKNKKAIILVSSHNLKEVLDISNYIIILSQGKIIFNGTKNEFISQNISKENKVKTTNNALFKSILNSLKIKNKTFEGWIIFEEISKKSMKLLLNRTIDNDIEILENNNNLLVDKIINFMEDNDD